MSRIPRSYALGLLGAAAAFPAPVRAQTATIRMGAAAADTFGLGYYAVDAGFFAKAGLAVELQTFPNGATQAAAAAGGAIDVGIGEATELANGVGRGLPFAIVAGGALYTTDAPTTLLIVAKNSAIATAKELEGETVAVPALVSLNSTAVKAWLVQGGADLTKVRFVELPIAEIPVAIARGTIAAGHAGEPALTAYAAETKAIAKPYDAIAKQFLISDWFTTRDWLAKNPDAAKRLVGAIYETARWANEHRDLTAPILAKYTKIDVEKIKGMRRTRFATTLDAKLIQPVLDAGTQYKALTRAFNAEELIARI